MAPAAPKNDQAAQDAREAQVVALQLRLLDPADDYIADDSLEVRDDSDPADDAPAPDDAPNTNPED